MSQGSSVKTTAQTTHAGQVSGKYYRTRSLSQNLQQIFHPNRQSHSRSINNLSVVGGTSLGGNVRPQIDISNINKKNPIDEKQNVPRSLPQSPRIQIETDDQFIIPNYDRKYDSNKMNHSKSLNFPPTMARQHQYQHGSPPNIYYPNNFSYSSINNSRLIALKNDVASPVKIKGYNLNGHRRNQYTRSISMEVPKHLKQLQKLPSFGEDRRGSNSSNNQESPFSDNQYQINEVVQENVELLRKYSDPKIPGYTQIPQESSLSLWQSTFKAKLASLFKNKKKYTIMEPLNSKETSGTETYSMNRCNSAQSLPALVSSSTPSNNNIKKSNKQHHKKKHKCNNKKVSIEKYGCDGKLKKLSLNPPQMIGGSYDNLLLINRMNKKKNAIGTYDTYHGRPLMSHASRLKALCKYRKPSESDDATTTFSFDYDSGDMSDSSSLAQSSDDEELSSSYSDFTNKSSSHAYQIRSSASVNSMPPIKFKKHETKNNLMATKRSPASSFDSQGNIQLPMLIVDAFNNKNNNNVINNSNNNSVSSNGNSINSNFSSGNRILNVPGTFTKFNTAPYHQMSQALYNNSFNRNDYSMTMPMMHHQYNSYNSTATSAPLKPLFLTSFASSSSSSPSYNVQMIKNFFTSGPGSSPLVSS